MMRAQLYEGVLFKKVVDGIKGLTKCVMLECSDTGIHLFAANKSRTVNLNLHIPSEGFDMYKCDKKMSICMQLSSLRIMLNSLSDKEKLTLQALNNSDVLNLVFESKGNKTYNYDLKLDTFTMEDSIEAPELDYDCQFELPSRTFAKTIRALAEMGEKIKISCQKDEIQLYSKGDITDLKIIWGKEKLTRITLGKPVVLSFDSRNLLALIKIAELNSAATLSLQQDSVLQVEFLMEKSTGPFGKFSFILASKFLNDDDD